MAVGGGGVSRVRLVLLATSLGGLLLLMWSGFTNSWATIGSMKIRMGVFQSCKNDKCAMLEHDTIKGEGPNCG